MWHSCDVWARALECTNLMPKWLSVPLPWLDCASNLWSLALSQLASSRRLVIMII